MCVRVTDRQTETETDIQTEEKRIRVRQITTETVTDRLTEIDITIRGQRK